VGVLCAGFGFWALSGDFVQRFTQRPWGYDVTHLLSTVLTAYPRYVLWREPQFGGWLFGWTGIVGVAGLCAAAAAQLRGRTTPPGAVVALALCYLLLFNFVPHKLDLSAYFSHPRIFRYLAQVAPFLYIAAAYLCDILWRRGRAGRGAAALTVVAVCVFGLWETPSATEPSWDSSRDGRTLSRFFREEIPAPRVAVSGDEWNCYRLRYMNDGLARGWRFDCQWFEDDGQKRDFLAAVDHGYVVTGGASLAWYSARPWVLNLEEIGFEPPGSWELVKQVDGPVRPWRREPLRVWRVRVDGGEVPVRVADPGFEACLRTRVEPLRPQDGLAPGQPITADLARFVIAIDCTDAGIRDLAGVEHFMDMEVLNAGGNALTTVDVSALTKLKGLILGANRIERVDGIPQLRDLRALWLGHNRLASVDVSGLGKLEDLRLDGNALVHIRGTEDLTALRQLFLGRNPDLDCDALALPEKLIDASGCGTAR
jgi:hypothetical protein